ncbi:paREP2b [Pyrobaculum aerophilum str. IM2]|uniref:PaREP2b n=2 Tax=Pyrobaculum aerophilum TaxID=13773 RepID=Q8ZWI9_PYRAE|nr:hypothetical protein [Pyrobaculum aerophilum]AAL63713.1 paREP2b [Pyrobaculum aerophilum str. IM2]
MEEAPRCIAAVEEAVKPAVVAAAGVAGALAVHDGLYSTAVVSATAAAVILAREGAFERAVEYVKKAAEAAYEAAREVFEKAKVMLHRLYELFVEAVARVLDYVKAHWFIIAAAAAELIAWAVAQQLDFTLWMDHVAMLASLIFGGVKFRRERPAGRSTINEEVLATKRGASVLPLIGVEVTYQFTNEDLVNLIRSAISKGDVQMLVKEVIRLHGNKNIDVTTIATLIEYVYRELHTDIVARSLNELRTGRTSVNLDQIRGIYKRLDELEKSLYTFVRALRSQPVGLYPGNFELKWFDKIAKAPLQHLINYGSATMADKLIAFVKGLKYGSAWARVVVNALAQGKLLEVVEKPLPAIDIKPYKPKATDLAGRLASIYEGFAKAGADRVAITMTGKGYRIEVAKQGAMLTAEYTGGTTIRVLKISEEDPREIIAKLFDLKKPAKVTDPGNAVRGLMGGWLHTDISYEKRDHTFFATTTSEVQAHIYASLGLKVGLVSALSISSGGVKPVFYASLRKREKGPALEYFHYIRTKALEFHGKAIPREVVGLAESALRELVEKTRDKLEKRPERREVFEKKLRYLAEVEKALEILSGKVGSLCITNCGEQDFKLTFDNYPEYAKQIYTLLDALEMDEKNFSHFLTSAIIADGTVYRHRVLLTIGSFESGELPLNVYHKVALWLAVLATRGVKPYNVYFKPNKAYLELRLEDLRKHIETAWEFYGQIYSATRGLAKPSDNIYAKLNFIQKKLGLKAPTTEYKPAEWEFRSREVVAGLKPPQFKTTIKIGERTVDLFVRIEAYVSLGDRKLTDPNDIAAQCRNNEECKLHITIAHDYDAYPITFGWRRNNKGVYYPRGSIRLDDFKKAVLETVSGTAVSNELSTRFLEGLMQYRRVREVVKAWLESRPKKDEKRGGLERQ